MGESRPNRTPPASTHALAIMYVKILLLSATCSVRVDKEPLGPPPSALGSQTNSNLGSKSWPGMVLSLKNEAQRTSLRSVVTKDLGWC